MQEPTTHTPTSAVDAFRPKRKGIANAEWRISAQLVRGGTVVTEIGPLPISDAYLTKNFYYAGEAIAGWLDEKGRLQEQKEKAQRRAGRKR